MSHTSRKGKKQTSSSFSSRPGQTTSYKTPTKGKKFTADQSKYANVRKLTAGTRLVQEAQAKKNKLAEIQTAQRGAVKQANTPTNAIIQNLTSNKNTPTRENALQFQTSVPPQSTPEAGVTKAVIQNLNAGLRAAIGPDTPKNEIYVKNQRFEMALPSAIGAKAIGTALQAAQKSVAKQSINKILNSYLRNTGKKTGAQTIKNALGKTPNNVNPKTVADRIPANTKTARLITNWSKKLLTKKGMVVSAITIGVVAKILHDAGFNRWQGQLETPQGATITSKELRSQARYASSPEEAQALLDRADETDAAIIELVTDESDKIWDFASVFGQFNRAKDGTKQILFNMESNKMISEDIRRQIENPELTQEQLIQLRIQEQNEANEQNRQEDLLAEAERIRLNENYQARLRNAATQADRERIQRKIAALEEETRIQLKYEAEKLRLLEDYWDNYFEEAALRSRQQNQENAPSRLGFGLL